MARIFSEVSNNSVNLNSEDKHYLRTVLRLRVGHNVTVSDPQTRKVYQAVVSDNSCNLKIIKEQKIEIFSTPVECIAMALVKGEHNNQVCEKATELGVKRIYFWEAENGNVKLKENSKLERYQKVALAAAKQSGKNYLPEVKLLNSLKSCLNEINHSNIVVCSLLKEAKQVKDLSIIENTALVVGPEGDFSDRENELMINHNYKFLSLSPYVLRAETAAITGISMIQAKIGFNYE